MKGKYKAFYFADLNRLENLNDTIAECVKLTKENLNTVYPSSKKLLLNIAEVDLLVQAFNNLRIKLENDKRNI